MATGIPWLEDQQSCLLGRPLDTVRKREVQTMSKPEEIKSVERAKEEWKAMEQEIENKAHELVANTPSRAEEDNEEES